MQEPNALPVSNLQKRAMAFVIDDIIVSLFFFTIFYDQLLAVLNTVEHQQDPQIVLQIMNTFVMEKVSILFALKILYHGVLVWQNGMTIGKYLMRIRVIDLSSAQTPTLKTAFLRALIRIPGEFFFYAGFIMAFFMPLKQALHDKISNCVVIDA